MFYVNSQIAHCVQGNFYLFMSLRVVLLLLRAHYGISCQKSSKNTILKFIFVIKKLEDSPSNFND